MNRKQDIDQNIKKSFSKMVTKGLDSRIREIRFKVSKQPPIEEFPFPLPIWFNLSKKNSFTRS